MFPAGFGVARNGGNRAAAGMLFPLDGMGPIR